MTKIQTMKPIDETDRDADESDTYVWDPDAGEYVSTEDLTVVPPEATLYVLFEGEPDVEFASVDSAEVEDRTDEETSDPAPDPVDLLERAIARAPAAERARARAALQALAEDAEDARKANEQAMQLSEALNDANVELLAARRERDELREQVRAEQGRRRDAEAELDAARQALQIADRIVEWDYSDGRDILGRAEMERRYRRARNLHEEANDAK